MQKLPNITPQRLAVKLKANAEKLVKQGHPWIFTDSISKLNKEGRSGDIAILFDQRKDAVFAVGLYDPTSPIRIKVISSKPAKPDAAFFEQKINEAFSKRLKLLKTDTNSYRFIFGENDGFPGLIADVYAEVLVVKIYSAIWYPYLHIIFPLLIETSQAKTLVLRLSRSLQKSTPYGLKDGQVLFG
jgi:23S rRNA (cytosine1962-C5)-methyltransferase